jgi:hypothetical protein
MIRARLFCLMLLIAACSEVSTDAAGGGFGVGPLDNRYSVYFDGREQYLRVPASAKLALGRAASWSLWIRPRGRYFDHSANLMSNFTHVAKTGFQWQLRDRGDGNSIQAFAIGDGTTFDWVWSTSVVPLGTWTHIAVTYDGELVRFYMNGAEAGSVPVTRAIVESTEPLTFGIAEGSAYIMEGYEEGAAIFNTALSQKDIKAIYHRGKPNDLMKHPKAANLVGYWRMGDGDDTVSTIHDLSGNGLHATVHRDFNLLTFAGTNQSLEGSSSILANADAGFSVAGTFRVEPEEISSGGHGGIVCKEDAGTGHYSFCFFFSHGHDLTFVIDDDANGAYIGKKLTTSFTPGKLYHYVLTYDGGTTASSVHMYLDSAEVGSDVSSGSFSSISDTAAAFQIGAVGSLFLHGAVGDVAVWDVALSPAEAAAVNGTYHFDPRVSSGAYTSAGRLIHFFEVAGDTTLLTSANGVRDLVGSSPLTGKNLTNSAIEFVLSSEVP